MERERVEQRGERRKTEREREKEVVGSSVRGTDLTQIEEESLEK